MRDGAVLGGVRRARSAGLRLKYASDGVAARNSAKPCVHSKYAPTASDPNASTTSGTVIVPGDSWA